MWAEKALVSIQALAIASQKQFHSFSIFQSLSKPLRLLNFYQFELILDLIREANV